MSQVDGDRRAVHKRPPSTVPLARLRGWLLRLEQAVDRHTPVLLVLGIAAYILFFAVWSSLKLAWFRQGFDMAGNEQAIWNTLHGRPFRTSVFAFMVHDFDDGPVLLQLPLALLYGIYPSPYTLLVLQSFALGLAAWPLFLIARGLLPRPWQALVLAAIYLLHPTTQHINMYEFQLRSFMIPFALGALLFVRRGLFWPYLLCLFLMLCTKTEAGFTLISFGLYALWLRRGWRFVITPLLLGPAWVALALGVIVPRFSEGDFITEIYSYGDLGKSVGDVIFNVLTNPLLLLRTITTAPKLAYVGQLFGLQGFLALSSPITLLALPVLMLNLISPNRVQFSLNYQYPALVFPFLLVAAADGLQRITGWVRQVNLRARLISAAMLGLLLVALVANVLLNNVVQSLLHSRNGPERIAAAQAMLRQVPPNVPLAATSFLAPHLAQREQLYFFPGSGSYPQSYIERASYIVADTGNGNRRERDLLADYRQRPEWQLVAESGDFVLLRRNED